MAGRIRQFDLAIRDHSTVVGGGPDYTSENAMDAARAVEQTEKIMRQIAESVRGQYHFLMSALAAEPPATQAASMASPSD